MNHEHWVKFYKKKLTDEPSSFAKFVLPYIKGKIIDLGCGNYRDTNYFLFNKLDSDGIDEVYGQSVEEHIKKEKSPQNVYTRFFWHAIERNLQLKILKWTKKYIFIEARTTEDKPILFKDHSRNFVNVAQLVKDLKDNEFEIVYLHEGRGLSRYKNEDPHLVRCVAYKK